MNEHVKHWIDLAAIGSAIASIAGLVPWLAALASLVWTGIRIYESATVQGLIAKRRRK